LFYIKLATNNATPENFAARRMGKEAAALALDAIGFSASDRRAARRRTNSVNIARHRKLRADSWHRRGAVP
jgi:hypothetical protein